jgi:hypothetical protein
MGAAVPPLPQYTACSSVGEAQGQSFKKIVTFMSMKILGEKDVKCDLCMALQSTSVCVCVCVFSKTVLLPIYRNRRN